MAFALLIALTAGPTGLSDLSRTLPDLPRFKLFASSHSTAAAEVLADHGVKMSRFASSTTNGGLRGARDEPRPEERLASAAGPLCQAALHLPQVVLIGGLEGRIYRCDCGKGIDLWDIAQGTRLWAAAEGESALSIR